MSLDLESGSNNANDNNETQEERVEHNFVQISIYDLLEDQNKPS